MTADLDAPRFLTAVHNQLNERFFSVPKATAKQRFQELRDGRELPLMEINTGETGNALCTLALDASCFIGRLNFTAFRNALAAHLHRIAGKLRDGENLNIYTSEETHSMIFHIPGLIEIDGQINIMVTGVEQPAAGAMVIRLQFLDPRQFETPAPSEAAGKTQNKK